MNIALVSHYLSSRGGGVSAAVEALSSALAQTGNHVRVFGLEDELWCRQRETWRGEVAAAFPVGFPRSLGRAPHLKKALQVADPELIHSHGIWMYTSADVAWWNARFNRPYVVSPHGMLDPWALRHSAGKKMLARWLFEDRHIRNASCLHALNVAEKDAARAFGYEGPVAVIPNGVELPTLASESYPRPPEFGLKEKILLYLGRLHPKKNVHGLIEAFGMLKATSGLAGWRLAIAGSGAPTYCTRLHELVRRFFLVEEVSFLGSVSGSRKSACLQNASAFILPSYSEGLPVAVLEAWAHARPVLITSACNLPEGYSAGAAYEISTDPSALAQELKLVLRQPTEMLRDTGVRGRTLVETTYQWDGVAKQFSSLYEWLLGKGSMPYFVSYPEDHGSTSSGKPKERGVSS